MNQSYQAGTDKLLAELNHGVLTISFNRPEAMNALHPEMLTGVEALVDQASADDSVCAIVLQGEGRAFSAGVDLKVLQDIEPAYGRIGDLFDTPARQAYSAIRNAHIPVIAKVHGACFTGHPAEIGFRTGSRQGEDSAQGQGSGDRGSFGNNVPGVATFKFSSGSYEFGAIDH